MSLTAEALRLMFDAGLSPDQIVAIAAANEVDKPRSGSARRQAEYRARKHNALRNADGKFVEPDGQLSVTGDVTCYVTENAHSLLFSNTVKNKKESGPRNVTRNASPKSTRCPADWAPDATVFDAGRKRGLTDAQINREIENIRDTEFPKAHSDWNATARRWMRNSRPDPVGRPVLAAVPIQSPEDIERRKRSDAARRARAMEAYG
jgi:hypothetical protein